MVEYKFKNEIHEALIKSIGSRVEYKNIESILLKDKINLYPNSDNRVIVSHTHSESQTKSMIQGLEKKKKRGFLTLKVDELQSVIEATIRYVGILNDIIIF